MKPIRLAWIATHPIQYQSPLLRAIAECPDIDMTVLYFSDFSLRGVIDPGFGMAIEWDTPLLKGFKYEFLPGSGSSATGIDLFQPRVKGLAKRLNQDNYDAVLVQGWNHYGMVYSAWLAKRAGLKVLMRCEATDHVNSSQGLKGIIREKVVSFFLKHIDICTAIGTNNRNFYLSRGYPAEKIGEMPYCVDNDHFRQKAQEADIDKLRSELHIYDKRPVILYASKFMVRKFPDHLLEAYRLLPEPRPYLVFVGDGEMRAELEKTVEKHKLLDVRFTGFQNQGALPSFYALADIFVLPSINETWGLVINEAMNAGCAIITTDQVGSATDLIKNDENGYVIEAQNIPLLRDALTKTLEDEKYIKMGLRSTEIIDGWGIKENVVGLRNALQLPIG